ncbi:MAG: flagellar hook-associated protein FlgK [Bacteroidetes bacterium]|nr:flagellar hook-associated protein FlgK [Bacteroidota bacterium]MCL5027283.1 flagellar hook-associated protein FlgK [Chloroflexota bacterium]
MAFSGLDIAYRALQAQQLAIDVVNHNIANVNTPGYSRQTARLGATSPPAVTSVNGDIIGSQMGTGVSVIDISRSRLGFVDYQVRNESQSLGQWEAMRDTLKQVEVVFNEPSDVGINSLMSKFWKAWQDVTNNPGDLGIRRALVEQADSLAIAFNRSYSQLSSIQKDLDRQISLGVDKVNQLGEQIAALNVSIAQAEITGQHANDLRDQRDVLLDDLSHLVRMTYQETPQGAVNVFVGSQALVLADQANQLRAVTGANGFSNVIWATDGSAASINDGELAGLQHARDVELPQYISDLQSLAGQLITSVNTIHRTGFGLDNSTNVDFFSGSDASDIAVSSAVKDAPEKVASAAAADSPGDNSIAVSIANLQRALTMNGGTADFGRFYSSLVSSLGVDAQRGDMMATNQQALVDHLTRQRESISGVSLDEETTHLIEYQRAYEAAARMVTAVDEMLDKLINGTGLVGR